MIIPAHNEASVIGRTLGRLDPLAPGGQVEVIVACNGRTDNTAELARGFKGVRVLDVPEPSKVAALNAADAEASRWPRLYRDADIEITRGPYGRSSTSSDVGLCGRSSRLSLRHGRRQRARALLLPGEEPNSIGEQSTVGSGDFRSFAGRAQTVRQVSIHFATIQR